MYLRPVIINTVLLFLIVISAFFLFTALPADPVRSMVGVNVSEQVVESLREQFGLNQPLWVQFKSYIGNIFTLNFGTSFVTQRSVASDLLSSFRSSLTYSGFALAIAILYSIISGFISYMSLKAGKLLSVIHSAIVSIPSIIIAVTAGIIFFQFNLFDFIVDISRKQVVTASLVLSIYPSAVLAQVINQQLEETRHKPFMLAASSFGFGKFELFGINFRASYLPWLAQLSNVAAALIAGAIVIEFVFSLPGLGRLIFQSVIRSDYPMLQGIVLVTSIGYIIFNMLIESLYAMLLPKNGGDR